MGTACECKIWSAEGWTQHYGLLDPKSGQSENQRSIISRHPEALLWQYIRSNINQIDTIRASSHLGSPSKPSCRVTNTENGSCLRETAISLSVITGYVESHLVRFWPWEVSGLLITASLANSCNSWSYATPLSSWAAVQILTFCACILSGTVEDKIKKKKNKGMDGRHPPPGGWGCFSFFKKKKR